MSYLYGYCDESGKYGDHRIVTFSGIVDSFEPLRAFGNEWAKILRLTEIQRLHTTEALQYKEPLGKFPGGTPEERTAQIMSFVNCITAIVEFAISVSVDVEAYRGVTELHEDYSSDPHYFAFLWTVFQILIHFRNPKPCTVGLICHDDQTKAMRCYGLLRKAKNLIPEVRERVTSICFSDDIDCPQLQASDLFAWLNRCEAKRIFHQEDYLYRSLFNAFSGGPRLQLNSEFFSEYQLRELAAGRYKPMVVSRYIRLR